MNNTEKLLRAFIEASGYDVYIEPTIENTAQGMVNGFDYKVTKKPHPLEVVYDGVKLSQLVENVYQESEWISYSEKSFHAVIGWFGDEAKKINEREYNIHGVKVTLDE